MCLRTSCFTKLFCCYNLFLGCSTTWCKPVDINREQIVRFYTRVPEYSFELMVTSTKIQLYTGKQFENPQKVIEWKLYGSLLEIAWIFNRNSMDIMYYGFSGAIVNFIVDFTFPPSDTREKCTLMQQPSLRTGSLNSNFKESSKRACSQASNNRSFHSEGNIKQFYFLCSKALM